MDALKTLLKNVFFPQNYTCTFCGREIFGNKPLCRDCDSALPRNDRYICDRCGRKTPYPTTACSDCAGKTLYFDVARSAFTYDAPISFALQNLKYRGRKFLAEELAAEMEKTYLKTFYPCEAVVCVPTSENKIKERGYNQSELLASALSKRISVPFIRGALVKTRDTGSQVGLSQKERLINLSGSFAVKDRKLIEDKTVLLIDDVLTTGTTTNLAAKKLKSAGAKSVFILTAASVTLGRS